ncbi:MAG: SpoIIE family protein phosphatase [Candidatus Korobacteraceae bacterium]|jgi:serine phosphatase RsbU (regulator of sigma subunit)
MLSASVGNSAEAELVIVLGNTQTRYALSKSVVTIGRRPDRDVVLAEPHVSRSHAQIERLGSEYFIVDLGSSHGTFVNGQGAQRQRLQSGDRIEIGSIGGAYLVFRDSQPPSNSSLSDSRESLSVIMSRQTSSDQPGELRLLNLFIEGARALNAASVLSEILTNLVEISLRLTNAERGFVFLCKDDGRLELEAGRSESGEVLTNAEGISHSVLNEVLASASEFVLSMGDPEMDTRQSIIASRLRSVVCIPLRKSHFREGGNHGAMGVLYLDSRIEKGKLSDVNQELIRTIAREAAALVENAYLVKAEQEALAYQRELAIASTIQQSMMEVKIPSLPFAKVEARNISCKEIGGDFYDVMRLDDCVAVVVADVSGKGISAALLASVLQGAIYPQLRQGLPLEQIAEGLNLYIYNKIVGQKYATMLVMKLYESGEIEYINCGHVRPLLHSGNSIRRLDNENLPVGLLSPVTFSGGREQLSDGDRVLLYTDGIAEAENHDGNFFGDERLEAALASDFSLGNLFTALDAYRAEVPLADDCTALFLRYTQKAV